MFDPIDLGSQEDDGTGDSIRAAFEKVNANFAQLAQVLLQSASETGNARAANAVPWPGDFVARHVTDTAPDTVPPMLGAVWVDTSDKAVYVSVGTDSPDDWIKLARHES